MNGYPTTFAEMEDWSRRTGLAEIEARLRYAQFGILCAICEVPLLRDGLVFKGGNALDFVLSPNRSTKDLDFSLDPGSQSRIATEQSIRDLLGAGLDRVSVPLEITYMIQRVRQVPPGANRSFIAFDISVGDAMRDEQSSLRGWQKERRAITWLKSISV